MCTGASGCNLHCARPFRHHNLAEVNSELTSVHPHGRVFRMGAAHTQPPSQRQNKRAKGCTDGKEVFQVLGWHRARWAWCFSPLGPAHCHACPRSGSQQLRLGGKLESAPAEQVDYCHQKTVRKAQQIVSEDLGEKINRAIKRETSAACCLNSGQKSYCGKKKSSVCRF